MAELLGSIFGGASEGVEKGIRLQMMLKDYRLKRKTRILKLKQADFKARTGLREFFKTHIDPGLRDATFREAMGSIGEDPDSPKNKLFKKQLDNLTDDTRSRWERIVTARTEDLGLEPGEIADYTNQLMRKEITLPQLDKIARGLEQRLARGLVAEDIAGLEERTPEALLGVGARALAGSPATAKAAAALAAGQRLLPKNVQEAAIAKEKALGGVKTQEALAREKLIGAEKTEEALRRQKLEIPLAAQKAAEVAGAKAEQVFRNPIGPRIASFLGLTPKDSVMSRNDLFALRSDRHPRGIIVPTAKQISTLQDKEAALRKVQNTSVAILNRIQNRPEVLGAPGAVARTLSSIKAATVGFLNLFPDIAEKIPGFNRLKEDMNTALIKVGGVARDSAQVRSAIISLTYQGGAMAEQTGRGFSDKDFINISRQIGAGTANPDVMAGVIRSYNLIQHEAFNLDFSSKTNTTKLVGLPGVDPEAPFADLSTKAFPGIIRKLLDGRQLRLFDLEVSKRLGSSSWTGTGP
jgi:hypothetical protein